MSKRIYLDYNATTAMDRRVVDEWLAAEALGPSNPSSIHHYGQEARCLLAQARRDLAHPLGFASSELLFTASGTEALNWLLFGLCPPHAKGEILTSSLEHAAIQEPLKRLSQIGYQTRFLPCGESGRVEKEEVARAITDQTRLLCFMAVNNETGVETDLEGIAQVAEAHDLPLLVDGVCWLGKVPLTPLPQGVTAAAFSSHKVYGPKGVGLACLRGGKTPAPLIFGGHQEGGRRGGTENLSGILAFAKAVALCREEGEELLRIRALRDQLEEGIRALYPRVQVNGEGPRVGNTLNLAFPGIEGDALLMRLDLEGVAVSHGAACSSGSLEPSHVLLGMGLPLDRVRSSLRFSLGRWTTAQEIERTLDLLSQILPQLTT